MKQSSTVAVEFTGLGGEDCELSWGQRTIWRPLQWYGEENSYFNQQHVADVPPGIDLAVVLAVLRRTVEVNHSFRSNYVDTGDGPRQRVWSAGQFPVGVYDCDEDVDRRQAVDDLAEALRAESFDLANEWPIRFAVCVEQGRPVHVILVVSHIATDGQGFRVVKAQLQRLLGGTVNGRGEPGWQPIDQAKAERTAQKQERGRRAVEYWSTKLAEITPSIFDYPQVAPADPRYQRFRLVSPALGMACRFLAHSCRVSTSSVLLTGASLLLSVLTGHDRIVLQLIVGNRYTSQTRELVSALAQNGLFVSATQTSDVADAIQVNHRHALNAYRHGHYDPDSLTAAIERIETARTVSLDLTSYFNDTRRDRDSDGVVSALSFDESAMRNALSRASVTAAGEWSVQDSKFFMDVEDTDDDSAALTLLADTSFLPPDVIKHFLLSMETLLAAAALGPVRVADIPALTGLRACGGVPGSRTLIDLS